MLSLCKLSSRYYVWICFLSQWHIWCNFLHIYTCLLDLTSWSFLCCTVSKVEEEDEDEGVQSETEGSEKKPFLGKDQIREDGNPAESLQIPFEELTEEVKLLLLP